MAETEKKLKPLLCPACFAKEIEPVFLHFDPEDQEYYCIKCCYFAKDRKMVDLFMDDFVRHKLRQW